MLYIWHKTKIVWELELIDYGVVHSQICVMVTVLVCLGTWLQGFEACDGHMPFPVPDFDILDVVYSVLVVLNTKSLLSSLSCQALLTFFVILLCCSSHIIRSFSGKTPKVFFFHSYVYLFIYLTIYGQLTFNGQMEHHPIKCILSSLERENVLRQVFKLNSAQAAAETWNLEGHTLRVKYTISCSGCVVLHERIVGV